MTGWLLFWHGKSGSLWWRAFVLRFLFAGARGPSLARLEVPCSHRCIFSFLVAGVGAPLFLSFVWPWLGGFLLFWRSLLYAFRVVWVFTWMDNLFQLVLAFFLRLAAHTTGVCARADVCWYMYGSPKEARAHYSSSNMIMMLIWTIISHKIIDCCSAWS